MLHRLRLNCLVALAVASGGTVVVRTLPVAFACVRTVLWTVGSGL
jgi:hypothetical protein